MNEKEFVAPEDTVALTAEVSTKVEKAVHPRAYVTKNGKVREDKLKPIVYHDNRNGGTYMYGKNASKRAKKALK